MPILEVRNRRGVFDPLSTLRLLAVMAHPDDAPARERYLARTVEHVYAVAESEVKRALETDGDERINNWLVSLTGRRLAKAIAEFGGFAALAHAPPYHESMEQVSGSAWAGSIAGDLLLNILQLDASGKGGSVRKAVYILREYLSSAKTTVGESLGGSQRFIQEAWRGHQSVAHLWASYRLWFFEGSEWEGEKEPDPDSAISPFRPESLPTFIALAMSLLALGASHYPHGRREPTLSLEKAWIAPPDLPLPEVRFRVAPLEAHKVELLKKYKPET